MSGWTATLKMSVREAKELHEVLKKARAAGMCTTVEIQTVELALVNALCRAKARRDKAANKGGEG